MTRLQTVSLWEKFDRDPHCFPERRTLIRIHIPFLKEFDQDSHFFPKGAVRSGFAQKFLKKQEQFNLNLHCFPLGVVCSGSTLFSLKKQFDPDSHCFP